MITNQELMEKFIEAAQKVKNLLREDLTNEQAKDILARYCAAVEGNFIQWMAATAISSQTIQGRYAAEENIEVEMRENHPGMLRKFVKLSKAEPTSSHYQSVHEIVEKIRKIVGELYGVKNIALMAYLENTSAAFIPYLAKLAKNLGCNDFTYTDKHGVADVDHADQFIWALEHEIKDQKENKKLKSIDQIISVGHEFLAKIFSETDIKNLEIGK